MPDIVLTTLNAKYIHAAFGLRYLRANLPDTLRERCVLREFDINQRAIDIVEQILADNPHIVGVGVYIWNAELSLKVVTDLKRLRPNLTVIVGGPEVSYETEDQEIASVADYVIRGEADLAFGQLCERLLRGEQPSTRTIDAPLPEFAVAATPASPIRALRMGDAGVAATLSLPYDLYTDTDLAHRVLYVEASRGCPFKCEFCLSSLDVPVRNAPLDDFLAHLQRLFDRGARQFKFVDRTFNLNLKISVPILEFFLARYEPGLFVHFEMIPDRLPEQLRSIIEKFPAGALQFEVGIQTLNPEVEKLISRKQDHTRLADNLTWLRDHTGVHVHADLIVGLPGEDLDSFAHGFDQLLKWRPQEIQIGILKRLRGTPIARHTDAWGMIYSPHPPYEILQTKLVSFEQMQRMRRFARYWDLVANSGKFLRATELLLSEPSPVEGEGRVRGRASNETNSPPSLPPTPSPNGRGSEESPFARFLAFSDWLFAHTGQRTHGIGHGDLTRFLREYLVDDQRLDASTVDESLKQDESPRARKVATARRQAQHLAQP